MKFEQTDKAYLDERVRVSDELGKRDVWSVIDHWPLYAGLGTLARNLTIIELVRQSISVPGHIAEFGCWRGSNLMLLTKLLKLLDPMGSKLVHGFDSFEGLTTFTDGDGENQPHGAYKGDLDELKRLIGLFGLQDDVVLHIGLIQDTLPDFIKSHPETNFSLVLCDTDLYEPTTIILNTLHERMVKGGMFILDEWNDERWPGEAKAVTEFMKDHGSCYDMVHLENTRQPTLALKKVAY